MHVLYEHHKAKVGTDSNGNPIFSAVATDLILTTTYPGVPGICWYLKPEKASAELILRLLKEMVNTQSRDYNPKTYVWSFLGNIGKCTVDDLQHILQKTKIEFISVTRLAEQAEAHFFEEEKSKVEESPEKFFYNWGKGTASAPLTKELVSSRLAELLEVPIESITRKAYLKACLLYHPDRNNGDGSKMSELNMLWQVWNT